MKIESIREPSVKGGRFTALLDNGKKLMLNPMIIGEFSLYSGRELDEETLAKIKEANAAANTKTRAVRIISATSVSQKELRRRLVQKGESEENADSAVAWLADLNLLDDLETARQLARAAARKGYGKARIRQIFYQKGIERSFWDEAMEDLPEPDDAIEAFIQSRLRGKMPDQKELKRVADALMRRGHSWSDIKPALRRYTDALEDDLEEY